MINTYKCRHICHPAQLFHADFKSDAYYFFRSTARLFKKIIGIALKICVEKLGGMANMPTFISVNHTLKIKPALLHKALKHVTGT